ncbi:MAG: GAF domain-containing protein, partial [Anaerolineae bacterium]
MSDESVQHTPEPVGAPQQGTSGEAQGLLELFNYMSAQLAESYAALHKSEERFSLAMQGANDGLWDWDVRTDEVYYSPRWKEMLGYAEDEVEHHFAAWERLVHPDDRPRAMEGVNAFLAGEVDKFEIEFRMRHQDGHYVDVLSRAFGVREMPDGPVVRIVGTHVDITERKRSEEEIRRQNEFLAALHQTTLSVVGRLDIGELLETLVERAVSLVGASVGFAYEVVPGHDEIEVKVGTGWFRKYLGNRRKRGEALSGRVWESGQPLAVDSFETWSGYTDPEEAVGPAMGAPLRSGTQVVGILGVARPPGDPPFQQDETDLIGRFADLASIALENARLHTSLQEELAERVRAERALQNRSAFEKIVTDISTEFINLAPDQVDAGIQRALQTISEFTGSDRCYVFMFSDDGTSMHNTHEWCRAGVKPLRSLYQAQPTDALPWFRSQILRLETVHIPSVADLPPEADVDRERCLSHDPPTRSVLNVPLVYLGKAVGLLGFDSVLANKTWDEDSIVLLRIVGEVFVNTLQHKRAAEELQAAYQTLEQRVQERTHELATLNAVAEVVSRSLDLEEVLGDALDKSMQTLDMEFGVAYRLDGPEDQPCLHPLIHRGFPEPFVRAARPIPLRASAAGRAAAVGEPVVWVMEECPEGPERERLLWAEGGRQRVSIPLMAKGRLVGAIQLMTGRERTFSPEQLSLLAAVGQQAGLAVENARLYEQAEQAAALAERSRLARGLHDSVTQSLYSVTMYAEAAARLLVTGQEAAAAEYLRDARDTAQEALREMRLLIFELRPVALEERGLAGALQARLDAVEKRAGVQADLRVEGVEVMANTDWLPLSAQQELYHIAQEALNNSLKHARAQHLGICLQLKEQAVYLEVADDGIGFDPAAASGRGGLGLPGMQERVQRLGGQLRIESAPGCGTRVSVEMPRRGGA